MKCWSCQKVRGKRSCPAHGGDSICTRCCGTKRRVEIRCPDDCPYLYGEHDPLWQPPGQQMEDMQFLSRFSRLSREQVPFLLFFHSLLFRVSRELSDGLTDAQLTVVISTLARTYQTLSKGIVYEHKSEDIRLQRVITQLGDLLSRRKEMSGVPPASDADVLTVLATTQSAIEAHETSVEGRKRYLDVAERVFRGAMGGFRELDLPDEPRAGGRLVEP